MTTTFPLSDKTKSIVYRNQEANFGSLLHRAAKSLNLNLYSKNILYCENVVELTNRKFKIDWCLEDKSSESPHYSKKYTKSMTADKGTPDGRYSVELTPQGMLILKPVGGKAKKLKSRT